MLSQGSMNNGSIRSASNYSTQEGATELKFDFAFHGKRSIVTRMGYPTLTALHCALCAGEPEQDIIMQPDIALRHNRKVVVAAGPQTML